ncbi:NAD(P)/FAD-dependent oxidoreductase [Roseitranquillus sediminis]|uniref:NAD(P)/FAD-dependent oxidoreductase n=1 Tax=Roseitranquillus sediminis TaxID=2809051 RepID=UPI001D0CB97A|nr:FAD-dependent oxidoreductase [Roseitranquillus sediminis]MBM9595456.1 FAD-binding oxidoreductase [Roseitranquillus sediminis]
MRAVVVGAGIFGASAAYTLAQAGAEVVVVDREHEGKATLAGAGIVCPWATKQEEPRFLRFYTAGAEFYPGLLEELAEAGIDDCGYRRVGCLVLARDTAGLEAAEARILPRVQGSRTAGEVRRVSEADAREMFPPLAEGYQALRIAGGARVEARTVASALLEAAWRRGAEVRRGLVDLRLAGSGAEALVDGTPVEADVIVVTAGAWANAILGKLGREIAVAPQRGQIAHLRLEGTDTSRWPVLLPQGSHYMLAFDAGRVVAGATRESGAGFDYRLTAAGQAEVLNFALGLAPGLASATHIETRIGFRPHSESLLPMIGGVSGIDNLFVGNGLGAGGLTMGPLAGRLLAQAALGQSPDFDLADYAVAA